MNPRNLIVGNNYYILGFHDKRLRIPFIQTLIFVGKKSLRSEEGGDSNYWCFQNPLYQDDPNAVTDAQEGQDRSKIHCITEKDLSDLLDLQGLVGELGKLQETDH